METKNKKRYTRIKTGKRPKTNGWPGEFVYVLKHVCVSCSMDPEVYTDKDREKALDILNVISNEIWIDKTYVDFKGTKFEKTFLTEEGWNALAELMRDTKFGVRCSREQRSMINDACRSMALCYVEMVFRDLGWNTGSMSFDIIDNAAFDVECRKDTSEEWRKYPGMWQSWEN